MGICQGEASAPFPLGEASKSGKKQFLAALIAGDPVSMALPRLRPQLRWSQLCWALKKLKSHQKSKHCQNILRVGEMLNGKTPEMGHFYA